MAADFGRPQKGPKFGIFSLRKAAVAAPPQARQCPAVLWIKQTDFGGRVVRVISPRLSRCWIFISLIRGGRVRARRQAPGRWEEALQVAATQASPFPSLSPLKPSHLLAGVHSHLPSTPPSPPGSPPPRLQGGRRKEG